ncbi:MAG TPA: hypothetical protein VK859_11750 [bacterium]|jgi:hypothetical protein|nr:hypothetical protein [bacterium]
MDLFRPEKSIDKSAGIICFCFPSLFRAFAVIFLAVVFSFGCRARSRFVDNALPLPPAADSGIYDGQFIQTDYGFAFPLPSKWNWLRLSAEQEVDEVARFADNSQNILVRVSVQILGDTPSLTKKQWEDDAAQDLKNHLFKIQKTDSVEEWKTEDSGPWIEVPFLLVDSRGGLWSDQEWALNKGDLLIGVHAMMTQETAESEAGKKLFKDLRDVLPRIHWYTPIGPRGISIDRFELRQFTESFQGALQSRSLSRVGAYFDDMYPDRAKWNAWYLQAVSGDPKSFDLTADLSGLVINGDYAAASFALTRKDKNDSHSEKFERSFNLSKKEGAWKITASLDKN